MSEKSGNETAEKAAKKEKPSMDERLNDMNNIVGSLFGRQITAAKAREDLMEKIKTIAKAATDLFDDPLLKVPESKDLEMLVEWAKNLGRDRRVVPNMYNERGDTIATGLEHLENAIVYKLKFLKRKVESIWNTASINSPGPFDKICNPRPPMWW